jgi:putative transposase
VLSPRQELLEAETYRSGSVVLVLAVTIVARLARHARFVKPETVISWQRKRFRDYWTKLIREGKPGRPRVPVEVQDLIRRMSMANRLWGAERIVGELQKSGIEIAKSTVEKYMARPTRPGSNLSKGVPYSGD